MIALRKSDEALVLGDFKPVYEGGSVYAFEREYNGRRLTTVCNMSAKSVKLPKAVKGRGKQVLSSNKKGGCPCMLAPFEFRLYVSEEEK